MPLPLPTLVCALSFAPVITLLALQSIALDCAASPRLARSCLVGSALRALCAFAARVLINVHAHAQWLRACTCTCTLPR
jgi:hypothetical protein